MGQQPEFTPEAVDEQLDQLLTFHSLTSPNQQFAQDLRHMYQDDEHSLARVWSLLGLENVQTADRAPSAQTIEPVSSQPQPVSARPSPHERKDPMHQAQKRPLVRAFALLAAACVAALLVSALLIVSNLAHQHQVTTHVSAPPAGQETTLPPGIYVNDTAHLYRLNVQTHQAFWAANLRNVAQIIPAGNVVYVLQSGGSATGVVKLDANTGAILWNHPLILKSSDPKVHLSAQLTNLVLAQNRLYVGWQVWSEPQTIAPNATPQTKSLVNAVYVLNITDGKQQATYAIPGATTLATANGILVVSLQNTIQAYDAATGKPLWHTPPVGETISLSIANSHVYATIANGREGSSDQGQSYIAAYTLANGQRTWSSPTFLSNVLYNFAVDQNVIYFSTLDPASNNDQFLGQVYAYDMQSNKQLWKTSINGGAQESLVVSNGVLYTAADKGSDKHAHVVALASATGTLKWQKTLPDSFLQTFALSGGVVYLSSVNSGSLDNDPASLQMDAVNATNGQALWQTTQFGTSNITPTES